MREHNSTCKGAIVLVSEDIKIIQEKSESLTAAGKPVAVDVMKEK